MPKTVRLSEKEQEDIKKICQKVNRNRVEIGKEPIKESELIHKIIEEGINKLLIT